MASSPAPEAARSGEGDLEICDPRKRRSSETAIWEDVLRAFAENDDVDFAYPTTRFYNNVIEGKPEARAVPPE